MMHCELESESNSTVWMLYTIMAYQTRKSETLEQLINAPLTDDRSVRIWVSATGFSKSVIYWGVKLFMALYVKAALLYINRFTFGSQLNSLNIFADGVLKSACNIVRAAHFWSLDILSRFYEEVVPHTTVPYQLRTNISLIKLILNIS